MYIFDDHYHKFNQSLLRFLGLWPFKKTKFERFRAMCFYMLLISHTIVQLAQLAIADFSIHIFINVLSDALPALMCVIKFNIFFFNTKKLKQILEEIINNRRMLTDPQEIRIVEHYAYRGKIITVLIISMLFVTIIFFMMELIPDITNIFWPKNESRTHYIVFMTEYHINDGIQFYYFFLYYNLSIHIGCLSVLSVSLMLLLIAFHCCAMFKICSYRIQHSADKKVIACTNKTNIIVERIIGTVKLHQNAQKLFKLLMSSFKISFLIILVIGICSLVVNLYRLMYVITNVDNLFEIIKAIAYINVHELYLLGTTYVGQLLVNHADELFNAIYMSLWYKTPVTVQKLFLFIMQISSKSVVPSIGGIYISVLESFTSVMSTGISFMMVLFSIQ